jgi:hypothetical protein
MLFYACTRRDEDFLHKKEWQINPSKPFVGAAAYISELMLIICVYRHMRNPLQPTNSPSAPPSPASKTRKSTSKISSTNMPRN